MDWLHFLYRLVEPGAAFHPAECLLTYLLPVAFGLADGAWGDALRSLVAWNAATQLVLFAFVVNFPTYVTGKMSYVDIGWPTGLVLLGVNALVLGTAPISHRLAVCIPMLLHGGRMSAGAVYKFFWRPFRRHGAGSSALSFYFRCFEEDLSRYAYAKQRWVEYLGPEAEAYWWMKQQQDTLMQCYANSVVLAGPVLLVVTNEAPDFSVLWALVGTLCWAVCWGLENAADLQMARFISKARKNGDRSAVVGRRPYNGAEFWLWTLSRHPNYFFEWSCWVSFIAMAAPSFLQLTRAQPASVAMSYFVLLFFVPRTFYDCLLYWTGAEPAEARSVVKRPEFRKHQATTRVLFPFEMPRVLGIWPDHKRTPGWPVRELMQAHNKG